MPWLVELPVTEPLDRMTSFLSYLDDVRHRTGLNPLDMKRGPTAFASAVIIAGTTKEIQEIIRIWEEWFEEYYPHIRRGKPMVTELSGDREEIHPRGVIIMENSEYADRVVDHRGKAPGDISADCVLTVTDASGKRKHLIFYPFGRGFFRQSFLLACAGAREIAVRWVRPDVAKLFPDLFRC